MAEVYTFLECEIKRVGTASGDSTETKISAYGEGVNVTLSRDFFDRTGDGVSVTERIPMRTYAEMNISKLYTKGSADFLFDGNDVRLYMANSVDGTETWKLSDAYWQSKGWSAGPTDTLRYEVTVTGNDFGTV